MERHATPVQFIKVTKESIVSFIGEARMRVVIAKAGYFADEIEKLISLAKKNIRCDVYVDIDEKSIRYGFGEQAALELINENLDVLNVQSANYIRMAIIIVDDKVMVYSPVALSWEEVPEQIDFPNGFIGGKDLADSLLSQIEGDAVEIDIEGMNIPIHTCPVVQKHPEEIKREISTTIATLKENPPVDPAELRKTTFYRHKYKLLKMVIHGVKIKNKSISLRPFNNMLPMSNRRLKSSWNVLTREDVESLFVINDFLSQVSATTAKHTFDAKRYGTLIKLKNIHLLENCIAFQVFELVDHLMRGKIIGEEEDKKPAIKSLVDLLKESRTALIDYLFPQAIKDKKCWDQLFANDQSLYRRMGEKKIPETEAVKQAVETFVDHRLNFPEAQEMIDLMYVEFDYYDISDELLAKEDFVEILEKFDIEVRDYEEGYEKDKQMKLFDHSE
jgi:hypothetical protein